MRTDTSERGLERLICTALTGHPCDPPAGPTVGDPAEGFAGVGWSGGNPDDYNREFCVDRVQLAAFLKSTQPAPAESLALDEDGPTRRKFLARLQGEIAKRGTIDVLRHGVRHGAHDLESGSFATAATTPNGRSTSGSSSTACRSSRSN